MLRLWENHRRKTTPIINKSTIQQLNFYPLFDSKTIQIILGLLIAVMFSSCMTERNLASQFVMTENNINVLIMPPTALIKSYYSVNPANVDPDSLVAENLEDSRFIKSLNDTAFVNYFLRSLNHYLERFQLNVYTPQNIDAFFQLDSNAYLFSVAQLELLEYDDKYQDVTFFDTVAYRVVLPQTTVEKSVWFEFSELNKPDQPLEVYYSMQSTGDFFDGGFYWNWRTGEMTYRHTRYELEEADVYDLAYFAGRKNAQYIFDLLMNRYVAQNIKRQRRTPVYYQYDIDQHQIKRANQDRFIKIPQNN